MNEDPIQQSWYLICSKRLCDWYLGHPPCQRSWSGMVEALCHEAPPLAVVEASSEAVAACCLDVMNSIPGTLPSLNTMDSLLKNIDCL